MNETNITPNDLAWAAEFIENKWIPALRSGDYKQGQHALRYDDDTFCCLGVACDLIDPNAWDAGTRLKFNSPMSFKAWEDKHPVHDQFCRSSCYSLPTSTRLGAVLDTVEVTGIQVMDLVAEKNDDGASFADIADFIESEVLPRIREFAPNPSEFNDAQ